MNKILASTVFAALMATSGSAISAEIGLASTAPAKCVVPGATSVITYTFTVDGGGAVPAGGPTVLNSFPGAFCNTPAKVTVKSTRGALTTGANAPVAAAPAGFANHLKYTATATWNALSATANANNTVAPVLATSAPSGAAAISTLVVSGTTPGSGGILLPGTYGDVLTVELSPV